MDIIEYENGLPKGYLQRRKKAALMYIFSAYLYCLAALLANTGVIPAAGNTFILPSSILILISCCFLCYSVIAKKNYKGLSMDNHSEIKAFSKKEKLLYAAPIIICTAFIPLNMLTYAIAAGFIYLVINGFDKPGTTGGVGRF